MTLHDLHRFPNGARTIDGHLRWDIDGLFTEVLTGLGRVAHEFPQVESIGIDMWAVDYGLLDADRKLLAPPISYRDERTDSVIADVHRRVSPEELYARNGLQFLPFNTLYQLEAERHGPLWDDAASIVLLPDLLAYWLTGELASEATNASTTGLVDVRPAAGPPNCSSNSTSPQTGCHRSSSPARSAASSGKSCAPSSACRGRPS